MKQNEDSVHLISKIKKTLSSTKFQTQGLIVVGALCFIFGLIIGGEFYEDGLPDYYINGLFMITSVFVALSSISVIVHQEMPRSGGLPSIKGRWAIFWGAISLLISLLVFFFYLRELLIVILKTGP